VPSCQENLTGIRLGRKLIAIRGCGKYAKKKEHKYMTRIINNKTICNNP
jgi:hypothetical protein